MTPNVAAPQPLLKLSMVGGQVFVDWTWQGHSGHLDSIEIHVDRADGK